MAASNREMDFTVLESFHLLYKNMWSMNIAYRLKTNIVDTILFKDGSPILWIFTSEQTGEIMKKKAEKLESIPEIVRALKIKSRAFTGSKDSTMRNKIAVVWYMESERKVNSYIVDESELKSILSNSLTEILCVQTYIGAVCFRGNGIFEHRVWTQRDGAVKHITYETINMERGCVDRFTCESEKLAITEHQHGALCSLSNQLITHMGFMNKCKVGGLIIQVVFSEGWVPHLVAAKKITFSNVPPGMADMREEIVYPSGRAPQAPVFNVNSLLLPISAAERTMRRQSTNGDTTRQGAPAPMLAAAETPLLEEQQVLMPQGSTKVRSSSISYLQHGSTKYTNFNVEQERKDAASQRQMNASSEKYISEAINEAKAIAEAADGGFSSNMGDLGGSTKVPFAKRGSTKFQPSGGGSSRVRSFSQSAKLPAMKRGDSVRSRTPDFTAEQVAAAVETLQGQGVCRADSAEGSKEAVRPTVHRSSMSAAPVIAKQHSSNFLPIDSTAKTGTAPELNKFERPLMQRALTTSNLDKAAPAAITTQKMPNFASHHHEKAAPKDEQHKEGELVIPYIDPTREPSKINYGAEDYFATVHLSNRPSTIHLLQAAKDQANRTAPAPAQAQTQAHAQALAATAPLPADSKKVKSTQPSQQMAQTASTLASSAGPGSPKRRIQNAMGDTAPDEYPAPAKMAPIHRLFRPDSASSVTKLRQTLDKTKTAEGAITGLLGATATATGRRAKTTTSAAADVQDNWQLRTFEINTEARNAQTSFSRGQLNDEQTALKEQDKVFGRRRPISAPHSTRPKHPVHPDLLPPGNKNQLDMDREFDESGKPNLQRYHPKGFSLSKPLPLSGTLCFGTYCNFSRRAKNAAVNENKEGAPPKLECCSECPHQVTYKSILLAKAETRFLGTDIDENIESLIDQIRLTAVSTEQLYTYLVRRHLNRVAEKCQEESRRMQLESAGAHTHSAQDQQADLNLVYRRLVYADALAHIHPSRFYYTVPLCEMCYKVYTFMDAQRETAILHNIDAHQQSLAAAAALAEKTKFTFTARASDGRHRQTIMPGKMVRVPVEVKPKSHFGDHDGEDPYEKDQLLDTDEFIPHHSAQRDIYNDQHKRDNFATTLRNNVASLKVASAEKSKRASRSPNGALSRSPSPPSSGNKAADHTASPEAPDGHATTTPPHSSRRKVVLPRDRVPVNHHDNGRFNDTSDSGLGSKGPVHPDRVVCVARTPGTISSWVQLLRSSAEGAPAAGANAQYDRVFGWRTNQEWDNQGNPKHLRPTSSSAIRVQSNRHLQRPKSAEAVRRQRSDSSADDSGPSAHVQFASGSQLQYSQEGEGSGTPSAAPFALNPQPGSPPKRRPTSAGAVPYPSQRSGHGRRAARREEVIASIEMQLANKMLELSDHLAETQHLQATDAMHSYHRSQSAEDDSEFSAAYAYSSLPFMAAPYLPATKGNTDCVADAAYTQLQIDPASHRVIPPQPTPQQEKQLRLEQEQREIRQRLEAEKQRMRLEEAAQLRQLQREREEIAERQARRSSTNSLKPAPSTEFIPVHSLQQGANSSLPSWQPEVTAGESAFEKDPDTEADDDRNFDQHEAPVSDAQAFHREQQLLQLQQQKEFRQLQLQQQLMHQKHQQQMLQQQIQFHERLKHGDDLQHQLSDSQVLRELDIPSSEVAPQRKGTDLRESVEMSPMPMSPPVFEFYREEGHEHSGEAFPVSGPPTEQAEQEQAVPQYAQQDYFIGEDERAYESDEDFVKADSGESLPVAGAGEGVGGTRSATPLAIDTTRRVSSVRFSGSDSFISPIEVDVEHDSRAHRRLTAAEAGVKDNDSELEISGGHGDVPESTSAKANHRDIQQCATQFSHSPDASERLGGPSDISEGAAETKNSEYLPMLSPFPELESSLPQVRSPPARRQSRAAESFPSPDAEMKCDGAELLSQ